ncbi:GTP-binding protein [Arachidicoccus ginsenosidivorans]|nr:GTP-binding protein [Arachidicoccus ginsenosidivorans]
MSMQIDNNQLLRFSTAGSVDDGKSTLIGRLLYDSKSIFEDQLLAVENTSKRKGYESIDLALFTDGLREEREQGITIDVAYRYFTTPGRKFIIADTPGHIQYTRNMITGASSADAIIILIDARTGVIEQTKRHTFLASLLQIQHLIICINKMDLVDYSKEVFEKIREDYEQMASTLSIKKSHFIPISALLGDNVVNKSAFMLWYEGAPLLEILESLPVGSGNNEHYAVEARFPVQTVIRPQREGYIDYRGYAGRVASGIFRKGDEITVLPSRLKSKIKRIDTFDAELNEAFSQMSVCITLEDDIDVGRGDMIVLSNHQPRCAQEFDVMLCWLGNHTFRPGSKFIIMQANNEQTVIIKEVVYKININTFERDLNDKTLNMNDIAKVTIKSAKPLMLDAYAGNKVTGSLILIDEATRGTVAGAMVL